MNAINLDGARAALRAAKAIEAARDRALADGDRAAAHVLNIDLEAAARRLETALAASVRLERESRALAAAAPCEGRRGGRYYVRAAIPDADAAERRPLSDPRGAYAVPVWSLDISDLLKFVAAHYAASVETVSAGGLGGVRLDAVRVDGGGAARSPAFGLLAGARSIEKARRSLAMCPGLVIARRSAGDRRRPISARAAVDGIAIAGQSVSALLEAHGWARSSRTARALRDVIEGGLAAIARAWGFVDVVEGPVSSRKSLWFSEDAAEIRAKWEDPDAWPGAAWSYIDVEA